MALVKVESMLHVRVGFVHRSTAIPNFNMGSSWVGGIIDGAQLEAFGGAIVGWLILSLVVLSMSHFKT